MPLRWAQDELDYKQYQVFRHCYNRKMKVYHKRNRIKFKIKL